MRSVLPRSSLLALTGLLVAVVAAAPAHGARYHYDGQIGAMGPGGGEFHGGSEDGQLSGPTKLALDPSGVLYVLDAHNHRVSKFTRAGRFLANWPTLGDSPQGLAVDANGDVYVSDWEGSIRKFNSSGSLLAFWTASDPGRESYGDLAIGSAGEVYVLRGNILAGDFIDKIGPDGALVDSWPTSPRTVAIAPDREGNLLSVEGKAAASEENPAPTQVRKLSRSGAELTRWPIPDVRGAEDIGIDRDGNVYITTSTYSGGRDYALPSVEMFSAAGEFLERWGSKAGGRPETYDGTDFYWPNGVLGDADGNLFVADWISDRILRFAPGPGSGGGNPSAACTSAEKALAKANESLKKARHKLAQAKTATARARAKKSVAKARAKVKSAKKKRKAAC